ncbi:hypothetical protein IVB30_02780 [Bradyrhizobium sp. 200]|uniref:hypothetical protein n=1 Tax=Bradyrhizobium sp. 200 TaxID=2782665 RepID=UPI0020002B0B|nr:hypothetical protein [Bradyrhizobium sp. 200]UPJ50375.1 hypothetical protein IVB30_02780 [Bradyrhizobium sp. 200]
MSALLDEAIEQLRELPEDEQDAAADALFAYIASDERQYRLQPRQADEVRQIRRNLASGSTRLATEKEVTAARTHRR